MPAHREGFKDPAWLHLRMTWSGPHHITSCPSPTKTIYLYVNVYFLLVSQIPAHSGTRTRFILPNQVPRLKLELKKKKNK